MAKDARHLLLFCQYIIFFMCNEFVKHYTKLMDKYVCIWISTTKYLQVLSAFTYTHNIRATEHSTHRAPILETNLQFDALYYATINILRWHPICNILCRYV